MTNTWHEKREYFRIHDRLMVEFRQVTDEEYCLMERSLIAGSHFGNKSGLHSKVFEQLSLTGNHLYAYLEMLDMKLNRIIDLLSHNDNPFIGRILDVDISGAGIRYPSDIRLVQRTPVELRIELPYFPHPRIAVLGRVTRTARRKGEEETWDTAVRFTCINEKDRDLLVNYIFSKERHYLRERRNQ
jgi:hypothetical protein